MPRTRNVQRQNREDRWFSRHKGCHVKMHPCPVRRGLVGWFVDWLGVLRHLMSYLQCRPDISTLAFRSNSNSHSDCDSQHQAGDFLSDLNSCLHWSNSRSNLGVVWHDKVKCWGYSHRSTTNEAIFKHLQTMSNNLCCIEWALSEIKILLQQPERCLKRVSFWTLSLYKYQVIQVCQIICEC